MKSNMRPEILFPLFADITTLTGVGAKTKQLLSRLAGDRVANIIYHLPSAIVDRRNMPNVPEMQDGMVVTAIVEIDEYLPPARKYDKNSPFKVRCYTPTGYITLVFFNAYPDFIEKQLPKGEKRVVSGRVERFNGEVQIAHPDYIAPVSELENIRKVEPQYPLTAGIAKKNLLKILSDALKRAPTLPEWIAPDFLNKNGWASWQESLLKAHHPLSEEDLSLHSKHIKRLAYDELLANQLALLLMRKFVTKDGGQAIAGDGSLRAQLLEKLPFKLTAGQEEVIAEIIADQKSESRMMRLLQGDVGSGKTVVALFAALNAVEAGKQVAIMAPTEILAMQHYKWISSILSAHGCKVELLLGRTKAAARTEILTGLKNNEINIIIGTHALFQKSVEFADLGLAIIDEQHRFGVEQRTALAKKGKNVDVLLMTATPIPRTLTLTMYGDMECSRLTDKPQGRLPIDTRIVPAARMKHIIEGLWRVIDKGEKIYWICPLIEESEKTDLAAAEERFADLNKIFKGRVGLMHGRMKADEREKVMINFRGIEGTNIDSSEANARSSGAQNRSIQDIREDSSTRTTSKSSTGIDILVATTVVEVGVDVPDATVIIIEHAERFGLSQLHQLRGRVGRNDKQSSCVLLYHGLGEIAAERLKIMRESNDGFRLAEEDLRLRGGGDLLGTKQSGMPDFKVANLYEHFDLLKAANNDAREIVKNDPQLESPRGNALKNLLYLFGYDMQIKYLKAA
jgi:ATP-dependent DNA helicase RecG